jgi:hypothetical protein
MILGVGYTTEDPAFNVGFQHKASDSKVAWRAMLEYWENFSGSPLSTPTVPLSYSSRKIYGLQLLGLRVFRDKHRVQPYLLGGAGLYYEDVFSASQSWVGQPDGSFAPSSNVDTRDRRNVIPVVLWGGGLSVRISGLTLFGESKFPMYSTGTNSFRLGPQAPLTFGIRF